MVFISYAVLQLALLDLALPYLRKKAKEYNIRNYSRMNKNDLVSALVYTFAVKKIQGFARKYCLPVPKLIDASKYILSFDIGIKNLAHCLMNEHEQIIDWGISDISANTYGKQCQKLVTALDNIELPGDENNTIVLLERQPGINPKMRVISGQLFMYFGLKQHRVQGVSKVIFYSPKHKLRIESKETMKNLLGDKKFSTKYQERKYLSKVHCRILLKDKNLHWIQFFSESKKQDDLSDSMLQSIAYLRGLK